MPFERAVMTAIPTLGAEDTPPEPADPTRVSHADLTVLKDSLESVLSAECGRQAVHSHIDGKGNLDRLLWAQAAQLGWLAVGLPEEYGGLGFGQQGLDILHRQLGRWLAPGPFLSTLSAAQWLLEFGGEEEQRSILPRIISGELSAAIPCNLHAKHDLRLSDGLLNGHSSLMLGSAEAGLVIAQITKENGAAAWAIIDTGVPASQLVSQVTWDRTRQVCVLNCEGAAPTAVIDDTSGAVLLGLNRQIALAVASDSLGGAGAISEQTIEYMKTRIQFDRPIGAFQVMKHRAADLIILLATQENLLEQGVEAAQLRWPDADMWACLAKAGVTSTYRFIADDCVLLHGGIGFTWEYDCHMYLKRARLNEALGMSNPDQYDSAAAALTKATSAGRSTAELRQ
jgi:alkylation response protein AidB-like acyl-CoA dehydrogenase